MMNMSSRSTFLSLKNYLREIRKKCFLLLGFSLYQNGS